MFKSKIDFVEREYNIFRDKLKNKQGIIVNIMLLKTIILKPQHHNPETHLECIPQNSINLSPMKY